MVATTRRCLLVAVAAAIGVAVPRAQAAAASAARSEASAAALLWAAAQLDSDCSDPWPDVKKDVCLAKNNGKCMWLELDTKNLCLPCDWDGAEVPCAPLGATYPSGKVKSCSMACSHHKLITRVSPCTDVSGDIARTDCWGKGASSEAKCMWTAYKTELGARKTMCGPCRVVGAGEVAPYAPGDTGPEPGSRVEESYSQCLDESNEYGIPCDSINGIPAVTPCKPTPAPTMPGGVPPPVTLESLGLSRMPGAPEYVAVPVAAPYDKAAYTESATSAARIAGWPVGSLLPPSTAVGVLGPPPFEGPTLPPDMKFEYINAPPGLVGLPPATLMPPGFAMVFPAPAPAPAPAAALMAPPAVLVAPPAIGGGELSAAAPAAFLGRRRPLLLRPKRRLAA